jgi:KDO2-lipid IV(A) lauroyltransferase
VEACIGRAFAQYQWHYRRWSAHNLPNPYKRK